MWFATYHDAGFQIGHRLQWLEFDGVAVRKSLDEVGMKSLVYVWLVDDVKGSDSKGECCCFDAAADNDLGLVFQTLQRLVLRWKLRVKDLLEDGFLCVVGLDILTPQRTFNDVPCFLQSV